MYLLQISLYISVLLSQLTFCSEFHKDFVKFISFFTKQNFEFECDFIFLENGRRISNFVFVSKIIQVHEKPCFTIFVKNSQNTSLELSNSKRVHKLSQFCNINVLFLQDAIKNEKILTFSNYLFELLTPRFQPLSKKDEDYYFIWTKIELVENLLKSRFLQKIKFKLLFYKDSHGALKSIFGKFFPWPDENVAVGINLEKYIESGKIRDAFPDILDNFEGRKIRVSAPLRILFTLELEKVPIKGWILKRGHQKFVFDEIQRIFNFSYHLMESTGGGTGFQLPNGTYIGTVSDIFYERADLALITGQVFERSKILGFCRPFYYTSLIFTVGIPKQIFSYKTIFQPLSPNVWGLFILTNILFFIVFLCFNKFGDIDNSHYKGTWQIGKTTEFIIGSIFEQGLSLTRKKTGRIICILLLMFLIVLSTLYKAKLFTFLIYPELTKPPETFNGLTQRTEFKYGLERAGIGAAIHATLKASKNPTFAKINREMSLEYDSVKCFLKGLYSDFACLAYREQFEYIFNRNFSTPSGKYPFQISKETTFSPHSTGFAMEKRSVFRTNFDRIFAPLVDGGIVWKMEKIDFENIRAERVRWQNLNGISPIFTDNYFYTGAKKLEINQLNGIIAALILFLILSLIQFITELFYDKILLFIKSLCPINISG